MNLEDKQKCYDLWASIPEQETRESKEAFKSFSRSTGAFPRRFQAGWAVAAAMVPVIVLLALNLGKPVQNASDYIEFSVAMASRDSVILPDGSSVWLNSGSRLLYPERFTSNERKVFLYGEGYFSVEADPEHPFIVCSGNVRAKVYGTQFNMTTYDNLSYVSVGLVTGKLDLEATDNNISSKVILAPGDVARYDKTDAKLYKTSSAAIAECLWRTGNHCFRNQTLLEITRQLERDFACRIVVSDEKAASRNFSMAFVNNENVDQMLRAVASNCGIRCIKKDDTYYLTR